MGFVSSSDFFRSDLVCCSLVVCEHSPFSLTLDCAGDFLQSLVSTKVDLREVAALIVAGDDSAETGEDGVAVAAAKAADIERIAAADDDSADSFEEEVPMEGADEDDSDGDSEDEDGEGNVWCWFVEEVGELDSAEEVST